MNPSRAKELASSLKKGSEIQPPRRCKNGDCLRLIKHDEASDYCSSDCHAASEERLSQERLREDVLGRDMGVCAECKGDMLALREELRALREDFPCSMRAPMVLEARVHQLVLLGFPRGPVEKGESLWQCDHDKERVAGGPDVLSNARTLCLACHNRKSSGFAKKRAASRKRKNGGMR